MKDDKVDDLFQRRMNSAERISYIVAVDLSGDTGIIRDCEVVTNPEMEGAVFRVDDRLTGRRSLSTFGCPHFCIHHSDF